MDDLFSPRRYVSMFVFTWKAFGSRHTVRSASRASCNVIYVFVLKKQLFKSRWRRCPVVYMLLSVALAVCANVNAGCFILVFVYAVCTYAGANCLAISNLTWMNVTLVERRSYYDFAVRCIVFTVGMTWCRIMLGALCSLEDFNKSIRCFDGFSRCK